MRPIRRLREYAEGHGLAYTLRRSADKAAQTLLGTYDRVWRRTRATEAELREQRAHPPAAGLISVVIPVYNTKAVYLEELLESLRAQSYENWEAVLWDGASTSPETAAVLAAAEKREPRFRVFRGTENLGISGNTNRAVGEARGEYIALCDHDDVLSPDALWRMAEAIAREQPDWLYSDEDMLTQNGKVHMDPHYKPDFCPEYLMGDNYISHLGVLRKSLLERVGGLRPGYDGSQDHDLYLRCAAVSRKVVHVPYTLYYWRKLRSSESRRHLDRCLDAAARAAEDAAARAGRRLTAVPVDRRVRLWFDFPREASVEVIVHGPTREAARNCFDRLRASAPWPRLKGTFSASPPEGRYAALNRAAAESEADYLLFLEASCETPTRHFFRELLMYACEDGVAGVTAVLTDRRGRIVHGGFALGRKGFARGIQTGLRHGAGGWHDLMNKVHNVSAVSVCCLMVRRDQFLPFDERYRGGLGAAEQGLRATEKGLRFVFTPHAVLRCGAEELLLKGEARDPADAALFRRDHGETFPDPCYPARLSRDRADYRWQSGGSKIKS